MTKKIGIPPSAKRLIGSLRDIGYDFYTAVADIVDNSVTAGATHVEVEIRFDGLGSSVVISDDGIGMTEKTMNEALRFGSQREYADNDLGRYGLGLKTASLSQCRRVTVLSRHSQTRCRINGRQLDLAYIEDTDRWEVIDPEPHGNTLRAAALLSRGPGTVVIWEELDRIFGRSDAEGGWAKRRLAKLAPNLEQYLGMVFHRFLEDRVAERGPLFISVNGEKVRPWNPFAPEEETVALLPLKWEIPTRVGSSFVHLNRYVLPPRSRFSSHDEFESLSGPIKWNRQQGLYIYRSNRMVQGGGWSGLRTLDEHTKLARASLEFPSVLDGLFRVDVAKMRAAIPSEVRMMLEEPVNELSREADAVYRSDAALRNAPEQTPRRSQGAVDGAALAIRSAAMIAGVSRVQLKAFEKHLREYHPALASTLGF
jgi:hypothetical protein